MSLSPGEKLMGFCTYSVFLHSMPPKGAPDKTRTGKRLEARAITIPRHNKPTVRPEIPDAKGYGEIPTQ